MGLSQRNVDDLNTRNGLASHYAQLGNRVGVGCVRATLDATDGKSIAAHGLGVFIPDNAIIREAFYKVHTTFTSATDAGTIALSVEGANDLVSAAAISSGTTWDASSPIETIAKNDDSSTWVETTALRELTATVAVEALTAGVLDLWVVYVTHNDGAAE